LSAYHAETLTTLTQPQLTFAGATPPAGGQHAGWGRDQTGAPAGCGP